MDLMNLMTNLPLNTPALGELALFQPEEWSKTAATSPDRWGAIRTMLVPHRARR